MDIKKFLEYSSLTNFPVGLGGCKNEGKGYDCCEYNITVFDNTTQKESLIEFEDQVVELHHGALKESRSNVLIQYEKMQIILDEQWELRMLLSKIKEKKKELFKDYIKSCLIDALFCVAKSKSGIKNSDIFASSWLKCGAYYISDALCGFNYQRPSPTHMLEHIREFEKNRINETFSIVNDCIGIERATPSLLSRMCKSTMGFSDMVESNGHSKIIQRKHDYLVKNSLLTDCYFYLGYINRNILIKIKGILHQKPELIHVLKVAFDIEHEPTKIERQSEILQKTANKLLALNPI